MLKNGFLQIWQTKSCVSDGSGYPFISKGKSIGIKDSSERSDPSIGKSFGKGYAQ